MIELKLKIQRIEELFYVCFAIFICNIFGFMIILYQNKKIKKSTILLKLNEN